MTIRRICYRCRSSHCYISNHSKFRFTAGYRWRMPKKNNDKAWKEIASGNYWWDEKAIAKKAKKQAESSWRYWLRLKIKRRRGNYEA